jgi:Tfp pilus assembly protein PilN
MTSQPDQQTFDTVTVSRVEWAPVPKVNLLPQEILDARRFRKVQFRLAFAVVATILLIAGGIVWAQFEVARAQEALDVTAAQTSLLRRQESRYAEVPKLTSAVAAAKSARETALAQDMLWYRLMSDIALATPSNVWLTTMNVNVSAVGSTATASSAKSSGSASASGAAAADPLVPTGIGNVTVTGTAASYPDVAAWLEAIVRVRGLAGSTLQTVTRAGGASTGGELQFTSQIVIDTNALSHRYDQKAG